MNRLNKRMIVSLILLVSLIMMLVSVVIVHVGHKTEVVLKTNMLLNFITYGSKMSHTWLHIHVAFGFIFVAACIFHIVINWRALKYYLIGKSK
jgi:ABC-type antimicrobial peptide transport system permease subunit